MKTLSPPTLSPSAIHDSTARCRSYLLDEIAAGRTAADLPTRFYHWQRERLGLGLDYTQSLDLFLRCCAEAEIKAKGNDKGQTVYFVGHVLAQPQYLGDD